jgi:immunity protein 5 of polymorphic toxin system
MTLSDDDRRLIALWAADCAERVLPLFEAKALLTPARARRSRAPGPRARGQADRATALSCLGGLRSRTRGRRSGCHRRRSRRGPRSGVPYVHAFGDPWPGETHPWACDRSGGRSSTPRRRFARWYGGFRLAALAAVGWRAPLPARRRPSPLTSASERLRQRRAPHRCHARLDRPQRQVTPAVAQPAPFRLT